MSKILATETPFAIGGVSRPPLGPQGVILTSAVAPYPLLVDGFLGAKQVRVGASHPVDGATTVFVVNGGLYPPEFQPGSPTTAIQAMLGVSCNTNGGFDAGTQGYSVTATVFQDDGVTGIPCFSPVPDPAGVDTNTFSLDYLVPLANSSALNSVRAFCPIIDATTQKLSVNLSLAAQIGDSGSASRFFFLPARELLPVGFIIQWSLSLTNATGRITFNNYRQSYQIL